jgi:hypothetical protein
MTELPTVSGQRVVRALARVGFINRSDYRQSCVTPTVAALQSRFIRAVMSRRALCAASSLTCS